MALVVAFVVGVPWLSFAQQPIRLGASLSLTGKYALQGGYAREGYLLCQKHVNQQGGVLGRSVEFMIGDDGSDEKTAVRLYEKLLAEDRVDAVIDPYSSNITDAVADVTEQHRKLMIAPTAATTAIWEKGRRYLMMMIAPAERLSEGLLDLAARNGLKTVAVINEDAPNAAAKGLSSWPRRRAWNWSSPRRTQRAPPPSPAF
jgi:branched-chain amino acid transport system substrate-binding protein